FAKRLGLLSQLREVPGLLATGIRRFKLSFVFEGIRWNELRVGMYGFEIRTNLGSCSIRSNTRGLLQLTPSETMWYYEDPSSGIFRAELLHLGKKELDQIAAAPLPVSGDNDQGVCLVGEYSNSARDNGFAL